jgi:outer membrane protein assembly factor BamB
MKKKSILINMAPRVAWVAGIMLFSTQSASPLRAADWPQFRGPGGLGVSADQGLPLNWGPTQNIAWKVALPGKGASSPIVVGSRVIVTCHSGTVDQVSRQILCFNRADGALLWSTDVPSKLPEGRISRGDHGYASSTPAADDQRIYAFFGKSGVFAFDFHGRQLWHADVGEQLHEWGSAASPVLFGDLVIVNASTESGSLVALDRRTGREVWRTGGIQEAWNTPLLVPVNGGTELIVSIPQQILAFDPASGRQLWNCATGIRWYMVPSAVAHDGVVYCTGGRSGDVLAVRAGGRGDVTATHKLWTGKKGSNVSSPIYHAGHLYWMNDSTGIANCVNARTGESVYSERIPRADEVYSAAVLAEGRLYYLSRSGRTFVLAAKPDFELLATSDLETSGLFNSSPAVAGSRFYIRSDQFLHGIGTP